MKLLFLGEIGIGQTSRMRMRALERLGYDVLGVNTSERWKSAGWLVRQIQRRAGIGPIIDAINSEVLRRAREYAPEIVWAEKQEYLRVETLHELRRRGARLVHFTPDPYFSVGWKRTSVMDVAMREFDVLVYCKAYERMSYDELGRPTIYMPLGYCDEMHRPVEALEGKWRCEVGFLGGWEPRRERMLRRIAATGVDLKIRGGYWEFLQDGRWTLRRQLILRQLAGGQEFSFRQDPIIGSAYRGPEVYGDDYARALTGAKVGVGFLRTVCPDQHTTRTFEIPACGSMLLADRTDEHATLFSEGVEAEFFSSEDELLDKVAFYRWNESVRKRIAAAGLERCQRGKYSYLYRMQMAMSRIEEL